MESKNKGNAIGVDTSAQNREEESSFNIGTIIKMVVLNWQWFVLSAVVCLFLAFCYMRYKSPMYQVAAKVLIKDDTKDKRYGGGQMLANMQDLGFLSNSSGFDNELEILSSNVLAREAVKDLKLYVSYKIEGILKDRLIYNHQPVNVDIDPASLAKMDDMFATSRVANITMKIEKEEDTYHVGGVVYKKEASELMEYEFETSFTELPASVDTEGGTLTFTLNRENVFPEGKYIEASISAPFVVATHYKSRTAISPSSRTTTIAIVSIKDPNPKRGEDFIKQLIYSYNHQANADKNEIALRTEEFINNRMEKINSELGMTENELKEYKTRNNLTNLKFDATEVLSQASQFSTKLNEAQSQIQLLDYLREYIEQPENKYQIIPSNVGLQDVASTSLISRYNTCVLDRNRLLQSASERAPQVLTFTNTLDELQKSIRVALDQARHSADINMQGIKRQYDLYQGRIANTPEQERILTQIGRQQEVMSSLYMMLLQKREENSISLAATADKGKMIDEPIHAGKVSPKSNIVMILALILGLGIPLGILYLKQLLSYKIEGHEDIEKLTSLPIVVDVPVANDATKSAGGIVVQENKNRQIDEIFRSLRTNLQFLLKPDEKVIMFTSTISGEGKTFNAANLAANFAFLGKRVIILGLDIRKPALGRLFGISDNGKGITPLLSKGSVSFEDIREQIYPSGINSNLDLLMSGPIPPNPTELLARENLAIIIEELKNAYDYIILDTPPVGLVTDTMEIAKHTNVTVFVCRDDYTPKSSFAMLNNLVKEGKFINACILLNGVDMTKKKNGYYYGIGKFGNYGSYGHYGSHGHYSTYSKSHYSVQDDNSIKM